MAVCLTASSFLVSGFVIAPALAISALPMGSPCGHSSTAVVSAKLLAAIRTYGAGTSSSATPSGSPTTSASRSPTSSTSPSQTQSASPSPSSSPSPTKSSSPSPSPTRSHHHRAGAICVTAQLVQHSSSTDPGGTVTYSIWVWSTVRARNVTASAASSAQAMRAPRFTLCPAARRTTCSIGSLPANQAFELMIRDRVRTTAVAGEPMTLTVSVGGSSLSPAEAAITTIVGQTPTSSPLPPPPNLAPIPGATISPAGLSGLFPVVTPQTSPSASSSRKHTHGPAGITQASSALPLDPRLIGGQLAGLAILAAAITMVVARLSLRTPQTASSGPAAPTGKSDGAKENESDQPAK
jgi:hypothetical protein